MIKKLVPNKNFIRNMDENQINSLVNLPTGIPNILMNMLKDDIPDINIKRMKVFSKHPEYETLDCQERITAHKMRKTSNLKEIQEFHINYTIDFLEKNPEFKEIVKIEF